MDEKSILQEYLPDGSVDRVLDLIKEKKVHLKITKQRKTKLGDYRPPTHHPNHRISINHNLNKYNFLITLVHEFAHLLVWEKRKSRAEPHGKEWKSEYRNLMQTFLDMKLFPADIEEVLKKSIINSKASSTADMGLNRVLKKYDEGEALKTLEDLEENSIFTIEGGRRFRKGPKQRTRYKCQNIDNNKFYMVHALVNVVELGPSDK